MGWYKIGLAWFWMVQDSFGWNKIGLEWFEMVKDGLGWFWMAKDTYRILTYNLYFQAMEYVMIIVSVNK